MAHFSDLTAYEYFGDCSRPGSLNVGWLALDFDFEKSIPSSSDLDLLWEFCKVSIAQTRGIHRCDFCSAESETAIEHNGLCLLLGTSEIRVFSTDGTIFAAPNLIFHYMASHHYRPPDEFLQALRNGLKPSSEEYFAKLKDLGLAWNVTSETKQNIRSFRFDDLP